MGENDAEVRSFIEDLVHCRYVAVTPADADKAPGSNSFLMELDKTYNEPTPIALHAVILKLSLCHQKSLFVSISRSLRKLRSRHKNQHPYHSSHPITSDVVTRLRPVAWAFRH
ncbi:hypothetical protein E4U11_007801 [Claviceps purpurea]|nr:hypothetical protein E4U11_007801 [Claviceps purpurea]